ncbi:substrate-binding domain-containing protein [Rhizobium herbae]
MHVSTVSRALDPVERKTINDEVGKAHTGGGRKPRLSPQSDRGGVAHQPDDDRRHDDPRHYQRDFPAYPARHRKRAGAARLYLDHRKHRQRTGPGKSACSTCCAIAVSMASSMPPCSDSSIAKAAQDGLLVVALNRKVEDSDIPYVINDEDAGICQMLRHLRELGHTRIAHIAGRQDLSTGQLRLAAFRRAAEDLDTEVDENLIVVTNRSEEQEGARCLVELLASGKAFTAVLCANDRLALGAIEALRERGIDCPAHVSVTRFNDMPFLDLIRPKLTTVRIQQHGAGRAAAEILLRLLNVETADDIDIETILPVELDPQKHGALPLTR